LQRLADLLAGNDECKVSGPEDAGVLTAILVIPAWGQKGIGRWLWMKLFRSLIEVEGGKK